MRKRRAHGWSYVGRLISVIAVLLGCSQLASADFLPGGKNKRSDCYVELDVQGVSGTNKVTCTDGDPACDTDGQCQGTCTFGVKVCLSQTNLSACTPQPFKRPPKVSGGLEVPSAQGASPVCSSSRSLEVPLKGGKKNKPGRKRIKATAIVTGKPKKEIDQFTFICMPRQGACPTTTTTITTTTTPTTTTTSTTVPTAVCGNGVREAPAEECDGTDFGGATCLTPGGSLVCTAQCKIDRSHCPMTAFRKLIFTNSPGTTFCGSAGLTTPPDPPFAGAIFSDAGCTTKIVDLGLGCLYIGGGNAISVPPGATPDGATTYYGISGSNLVADPGTGPGTCSQKAGPGMHCIGPTNPGMACAGDGDCGGSPGSCALDANCFFAAPLPIENAGLSTCVVNVFQSDSSGTVDLAAGASSVTIPLSSRTYLTGSSASPCPKCVGGTCDAGANAGMACTPAGTLQTSLDCPPSPGNFLAPLAVTLGPLTSGTASSREASGKFCPGQAGGGAFGAAGAFGKPAAQCIQETGSSGGDLTDGNPHPGNLASVFCIPPTGNPAIDPAADLPGPGAFSITGNAQALP
jgi:hypothetical protein